MSPPVVFALAGRVAVGKDFVAERAAKILGDRGVTVLRGSFAEAVKRAAADTHGLDFGRLMADRAYKEEHRQLLIDTGMAGRAENPVKWVDALWARVTDQQAVIVSDCRFPNEVLHLAKHTSVVLIHVCADKDTRERRGWVPRDAVDSDPSETGFDDNDVLRTIDTVAKRIYLFNFDDGAASVDAQLADIFAANLPGFQ